jgi:hypothetical protein
LNLEPSFDVDQIEIECLMFVCLSVVAWCVRGPFQVNNKIHNFQKNPLIFLCVLFRSLPAKSNKNKIRLKRIKSKEKGKSIIPDQREVKLVVEQE